MPEEIRVHVVDKGRTNLYLRYVDPITGKHVTKSAGTSNETEARKAAGSWETELRNGLYKPPSRVLWSEFRDRYEREISSLSDNYVAVMSAVFNHFEALGIEKLARIDTHAIDRFKDHLRHKGVKESTIRSYLKHLKAGLNWAYKKGMLASEVDIELPKRARAKSQMKGRPISREEFQRIIKAVREVRPNDAGLWRRYLHGMWLSGLRLDESLRLSWEEDADICVDLYGKHPRFRLFAEGHKARKDQLLPMTPDFADWLLKVPVEQRYGLVFPLGITSNHAGRIISRIARRAGVKASAHDLRRSFGTAWSKKAMPAILQKLMRHADIKTTMEFYVSHDADDIGDQLRSGDTLGDTLVGTTGFEPATS